MPVFAETKRRLRTVATVSLPPETFHRRQLPDSLVCLSSEEGRARFTSSLAAGYAESFFPLVSQYQTQSHPALCGVASLASVMNALNIDPKRVWAHPWRWFAEPMLDCCADMEKAKEVGWTLDQLACTAQCNGASVHISRNLDVDSTRKLLETSCRANSDQSEFVIASYDRKTLGQTGMGHFSPVAAVDPATDSALILDVARFKYGPYWVRIEDLASATMPKDPASGLSRGFVTLRKAKEKERSSSVDLSCRV